MVDTPRTLSYLLNNVFQDGQPINSINPQDFRDMIVTWGYRTLPSVMEYGAVGDGVTNDTAAWNAALLANSSIVVPPLKFALGNVIVNSGNAIIGLSSVAAAYPGTSAATAGTTLSRPVLQAVSGATRIFNVDNAYSYEISGFLLDGINKGPNGIEQPTFANKSAGTIRDCLLTNFNTAANINYGVVHAYQCTFGDSNTGMLNPLDSMLSDCDFAGNSGHGLFFGAGSGSTSVDGCRFEWNAFTGVTVGDGVSLANGAGRVTITGGWFDRNGWAGVAVEPGTDVSITGADFMRNGSLDNGLWAQCHIYLWGCSRVAISGITTSIGTNDDGSGVLSPRYVIGFDTPAGADISISGTLTGYTVSAIGGTPPADTTTSATTHVTSGTAVLTNLSTTATACIGQRVNGAGMPIYNTILTIDSTSQVTMKYANTATATGVAVTFKGGYTQTGST